MNILEHKQGVIGTTVFHILLVLFLCLYGFTSVLAPPEEGILIDFGDSKTGKGIVNPMQTNVPPPIAEVIPPKIVEEPDVKPVVDDPKGEDLLTQDFEDAVEKKKADDKKRLEDEAKKKKEDEDKKEEDRLKEIERQKELERQIEIEKQRKEQVRVDSLNALKEASQNLFNNAMTNSQNVVVTSGQGSDAEGSGNTGSPTGGDTGNTSGEGAGNKGIAFNLNGRSAVNMPKPLYNIQEEGRVDVMIRVNRQGVVTFADPGIGNSSTLNKTLLAAAKKAALQTTFNSSPNSAEEQQGTITYYFKLR